ncbi:hypothetical protein DT594_02900 [Halopseudomonas laoshanensis]|uniref:Uncharacterized protein n=1 Tax=Halopseudomonas laoshanensis TaxID=2268758 RepID=A0A7V7GVZ2_9GAMM|nr:hypothetical protein DT594_02900 [Halopseudomonas laoshanensis]
MLTNRHGGASSRPKLAFSTAAFGTAPRYCRCRQNINEADERMRKSDVKYRFVIDMATLKAA